LAANLPFKGKGEAGGGAGGGWGLQFLNFDLCDAKPLTRNLDSKKKILLLKFCNLNLKISGFVRPRYL